MWPRKAHRSRSASSCTGPASARLTVAGTERTAQAALKAINDGGGIAGRPVELLFEDDATDPKRGAEVVDKLTQSDGCDVVMGTLFSHVVMRPGAPRG